MYDNVALKQPTNPDSAVESSASSTHLDTTLIAAQNMASANLLNGALTPSATGLAAPPSNSMMGLSYTDPSYDFFDPQHWLLDGLVDFNYSFIPPMESS